MKLQEVIIKILTSDSRLSTAVGSRVHWVKAPQNSTTPYITAMVIGEKSLRTLSEPAGLTSTQVQFMIVGTSAQQVIDTVRLVHAALSSWPLTVNVGATSYTLQAAVRVIAEDSYDDKSQQFYSILRYDFYYAE